MTTPPDPAPMLSEWDVESIGPHRLLAGDVTTPGALDTLMRGERADIIYTDPPWGPGALQMFATMHRRGSAPAVAWPEFLRRFCERIAAARAKGRDTPVFVEMGERWADETAAAMTAADMPVARMLTTTYGSGAKLTKQRVLYSGPVMTVRLDVEGKRGEKLPVECLRAVQMMTPVGADQGPRIVLDPCCGLGLTAKATQRRRMCFRGLELNPARLARTAAWLRVAVSK